MMRRSFDSRRNTRTGPPRAERTPRLDGAPRDREAKLLRIGIRFDGGPIGDERCLLLELARSL